MLNKILLSGLLVTSSFFSLSSVNAMLPPEELTLSGRKLVYGLKNGEVKSKGKAFSVRDLDGKTDPKTICKDKKFTVSSTSGVFTFVDYENGQGVTRFNSKTSTWELILETNRPGQKLFELEVKKLDLVSQAQADSLKSLSSPQQDDVKGVSSHRYKLQIDERADKNPLTPQQVHELVGQENQIIQIGATSYRVKSEGAYTYDPDNNSLRKEGNTYVHIKEVQAGYRQEYDGGLMTNVPIMKEIFRITLTPENN